MERQCANGRVLGTGNRTGLWRRFRRNRPTVLMRSMVRRDIDPCDLASQVNQAEKEAAPLERNVCLHRGKPGGRLMS